MMLTNYEFLQKLQSEPCVNQLILFGSRARGDARERSDIDLAIDCPSATGMDWRRLKDVIDDADTLLKIDAVRYDALSEKSQLKHSINEEGVVLYVKK